MKEKITPLQHIDTAGILFVDKPRGVTSHDVVDWARVVTGVRKIGHTGTLDPLATGLLILLISRQYTKMQQQFLKQDKSYICQAELGVNTDTYDAEGAVIATAEWEQLKKINIEALEMVLAQFNGKIKQTVPPFSAVKRRGKKLYELARDDALDTASLPSRNVTIHTLQLLSFNKDKQQQKITFSIKVSCSSGTYIRSLIHDIGAELEVGATVTDLRRIEIGDFDIDDAVICPLI